MLIGSQKTRSFADYEKRVYEKYIKEILPNLPIKICSEYDINVIRIEIFSNEQIKQFLQKLYKINNSKYLEQICEISKGNIRYVVMAGQKAINEGLNAITNVEQLFNAWQNCNVDDEYYFVKYFAVLNPNKSLLFVKNKINNMEIVPYDIKDFENYKDSKDNIESFEIEVLSQFKETDQYEDSIELLLEILNKNPKYIKNSFPKISNK